MDLIGSFLLYSLLSVLFFNRVETLPPVFDNVDSPIIVADGTTGYVVLDIFDVTYPGGGIVTCSHSGDVGTFKLTRYPGNNFRFGLIEGVSLDHDVTAFLTSTQHALSIMETTHQFLISVKPNEPPAISSPVTSATVSENNAFQRLLLTLDVADAENDTFACALKSISPNTSAFGFWKNGTDYQLHSLTNHNLEYAVASSYDVTVRCWDQKGYSYMTVVVYVIPNYPPVFTNLPTSERTINANASLIGTHVYTVSTSDVDSTSVTYSMTSLPEVPELFEISTATGEILTLVNLKYAVHNGYLLTITASDGKANTTGYLKINLYNVNSVPVVQNLPAEIYVNENTPFDTYLYTLYTDDPGDVVYVKFDVEPAALKNKFYMQFNTTHQRQHHSLLDYEECNYFVVTFYAYDGKATSEPYNLTINVIDRNEACDFTPDVFYVSLDEGNSLTNYVDPNFNVKDVDVGDIVIFEIVKTSTAATTYFAINQSTGVITHALKYNVDQGVHPSSVTLLILGVDLGLSTCTATVSVTVTDVNDNVPSFSAVSYVQAIYEYDGPGTTVMQLKNSVTDRDSGDNAQIVFTYQAVTAGSDAFFHWTPDGVGTLSVAPSYVMTPGDVHRFLVTATDMGKPPLAATMTVDIVYLLNGTTPTPEVTSVTETSSVEFWEQTSNIVLVTLVCFLGLLLAGTAAFLAYRLCTGKESTSKPPSSPSSQYRKITPQPATPPDRHRFDFWHSSDYYKSKC